MLLLTIVCGHSAAAGVCAGRLCNGTRVRAYVKASRERGGRNEGEGAKCTGQRGDGPAPPSGKLPPGADVGLHRDAALDVLTQLEDLQHRRRRTPPYVFCPDC